MSDEHAITPAAPFLFSEEEMSALETLELKEGKYTGERLATRRPHVYSLVVKLLGERWSVNSICQVCGIHPYTVAAVGQRERISIEEHKEVTINALAFTSRMLIERIMELAPKADDLKALGVTLGISIEKLQLLSGGATARVEGLDAPQKNPFTDWLAQAKPVAGRVMEALEMGSDGAANLQSGAAAIALGAGVPTDDTDSKSDDSTAVYSDGIADATALPTDSTSQSTSQTSGEEPRFNDQGGRGSSK